MKQVCDHDCFHCIFADCICDDMTLDDYSESRYRDRDLMRTPEQKKIAAKQKAYREANRDEIAAKQKAYYEANRDEIAAKQKAYYEANRDEIAAKHKAYYEANRDEIAAYKKAYYQKIKEAYMEYLNQALTKLNDEAKEKITDSKANAMKSAVLTALKEFCRQDEEFAQAVVQGGTFAKCMEAVAKGVGSSISDLDAFKKAVQFYFPGAEVQFKMEIDVCPNRIGAETSRKVNVIDLATFL